MSKNCHFFKKIVKNGHFSSFWQFFDIQMSICPEGHLTTSLFTLVRALTKPALRLLRDPALTRLVLMVTDTPPRLPAHATGHATGTPLRPRRHRPPVTL